MMFVLYDGWLRMNRTEMINDFKNFLRDNQESLNNHITKIEDMSPDDEWALDDEWDKIYLQELASKNGRL